MVFAFMLNMGSIALNGYIKSVKAALQPYLPCNLVRDSSQCYFKNSSRVHFLSRAKDFAQMKEQFSICLVLFKFASV